MREGAGWEEKERGRRGGRKGGRERERERGEEREGIFWEWLQEDAGRVSQPGTEFGLHCTVPSSVVMGSGHGR
jgi:hypothetical protein